MPGINNPIQITTKNQDLEGKTHPITGVPYVRKKVFVHGTHTKSRYIEGVFPVFEYVFDTTIPEEMYYETDNAQGKYCMAQLRQQLYKNPELESRFTEEQLEAIYDETSVAVPGYTWHHTEEPGKFQLVDTEIHSGSGHTGGRNIWGGGTDNR